MADDIPTAGKDAEFEQLDSLAAEFAEEYRRGQAPSIADYAAQHPALAEEIRDLFPTIVAMEQVKTKRGRTRGGSISLGGARPERLGQFRLIREIGRGGMGIVYEAQEDTLDRRVALKVLPRQSLLAPELLKRFQREAQIVAGLRHPHIVTIFGIGEQEGFHYYVMQLVRGVGLDRIIGQLTPADQTARSYSPPVNPDSEKALDEILHRWFRRDAGYWISAARIGLQAAEALHYAHTQRTVHCDIKPANLLVDPQGNVWITDFGVAKAMQFDRVTRTGDLTGTLQYMAPERFQGRTDPRSDVCSLGLTLYELVTLHPAYFDADQQQLIRHIVECPPVPPRKLDRHIPRDLETILIKATERDPERRYPSAEAMAEDLRRYLNGRPILARRVSPAERMWLWCRRNPVTAGLATAVVFLACLVGAMASMRTDAKTPDSAISTPTNDAAEASSAKPGSTDSSSKRGPGDFSSMEEEPDGPRSRNGRFGPPGPRMGPRPGSGLPPLPPDSDGRRMPHPPGPRPDWMRDDHRGPNDRGLNDPGPPGRQPGDRNHGPPSRDGFGPPPGHDDFGPPTGRDDFGPPGERKPRERQFDSTTTSSSNRSDVKTKGNEPEGSSDRPKTPSSKKSSKDNSSTSSKKDGG